MVAWYRGRNIRQVSNLIQAAILTFRVEPPLNEVNELQEQSQPVGANEESSHANRNSIQPLRIACLVLALSAFTWLHTLKLSPEVRLLYPNEILFNNVTQSYNHFQQVDKAVVAQVRSKFYAFPRY